MFQQYTQQQYLQLLGHEEELLKNGFFIEKTKNKYTDLQNSDLRSKSDDPTLEMVSNRRDELTMTKRSLKNDFMSYPASFKIPDVREEKSHSTNYDKNFKKISKNLN